MTALEKPVSSTNSIDVDFAVSVGQVQRASGVWPDVRSTLVGSIGGLRQREERRTFLSQQR